MILEDHREIVVPVVEVESQAVAVEVATGVAYDVRPYLGVFIYVDVEVEVAGLLH